MKVIKKFKDVPWSKPTYENPWFAGYDAPEPRCPGHRLYVPKENNLGCMGAAFNAAFMYGETKVGIREWQGYSLVMEVGEIAGQTVSWPHIHLLPK